MRSGRSLRAWWLLNLVAASYHLYFDLTAARTAWPHPRTELVLQLAGLAARLKRDRVALATDRQARPDRPALATAKPALAKG